MNTHKQESNKIILRLKYCNTFMHSILTYTLNLMPHEADLGNGAHSFCSSLSEDKPLV